jgi:hypothetical protein
MRLGIVILIVLAGAPLAAGAATVGAAGAQAPATGLSETAKVDGCTLLASVIAQSPHWKARLAGGLHTFGTIGSSQRCEFTSTPIKGVNFQFLVVLYFGEAATAALARLKISSLRAYTEKSGHHTVALSGVGADGGWAVELNSAAATVTHAYWSKGRYLGWLNISGPNLTADLDNAKDLLRLFLRRLPRG